MFSSGVCYDLSNFPLYRLKEIKNNQYRSKCGKREFCCFEVECRINEIETKKAEEMNMHEIPEPRHGMSHLEGMLIAKYPGFHMLYLIKQAGKAIGGKLKGYVMGNDQVECGAYDSVNFKRDVRTYGGFCDSQKCRPVRLLKNKGKDYNSKLYVLRSLTNHVDCPRCKSVLFWKVASNEEIENFRNSLMK